MSETIDDGGRAFPSECGCDPSQNAARGMALRDYFAAKAMQGMLASDSNEFGGYGSFTALAERAYEYADAMIEARKETK